jgi:hypothetical protein
VSCRATCRAVRFTTRGGEGWEGFDVSPSLLLFPLTFLYMALPLASSLFSKWLRRRLYFAMRFALAWKCCFFCRATSRRRFSAPEMSDMLCKEQSDEFRQDSELDVG